jgi:hypothetical protein
MKILCSFLLILLCISCGRNSNKVVTQSETLSINNEQKNLSPDVENENLKKLEENQLRLQELSILFKKVGFLELPYNALYPSQVIGKHKLTHQQNEKLISQDFNYHESEVYGFIPDTTNYYAILFTRLGHETLIPCIISYSKSGELIENKTITEENSWLFPGTIISCEEYTTIEKDLTLKYYYKMIYDYESYDKNNENVRFKYKGKYDTDSINYKRYCDHFEKEGYISETGKIVFKELVKLKFRELIKIENE